MDFMVYLNTEHRNALYVKCYYCWSWSMWNVESVINIKIDIQGVPPKKHPRFNLNLKSLECFLRDTLYIFYLGMWSGTVLVSDWEAGLSFPVKLYPGHGLNRPAPFLLDWLAVSPLASLCSALWRSQLFLKHGCEQKKLPWMLSLMHVGHWSLAGSSHPGVSQLRPSISERRHQLRCDNRAVNIGVSWLIITSCLL